MNKLPIPDKLYYCCSGSDIAGSHRRTYLTDGADLTTNLLYAAKFINKRAAKALCVTGNGRQGGDWVVQAISAEHNKGRMRWVITNNHGTIDGYSGQEVVDRLHHCPGRCPICGDACGKVTTKFGGES